MIIIDTDILIDTARNAEEAVSCISRIETVSRPAISALTQMELIVGCRNKSELRVLDAFLDRFAIIPVDEDISDESVALLRKYRLSHGLLIADAMIAATAIVCGVRFITKNQRDYRFIDGLDMLAYPAPSY